MRPALLAVLVLSIPCAALAQPDPNGGGARTWDDIRPLPGGLLRVRTQWDEARGPGGRTSTVRIERLAPDGRTVTASAQLFRGPAVVPAVATSDDVALVSLVHEGPSPFVKLAFVDVPAAGGLSVRPTLDAPRAAGRTFPSWAVVAADPSGFAILWQETSMTDPNDAAHSFLARLRRDGSWAERPHEIAVPWPTAAMAWNGRGWHLALWFGGFGGAGGPDGIRVCLVTLSEAGVPEQHPWWVSRPERVGEIQMLRTRQGSMQVYWRGGRDGETLRSIESAGIGNWGQEPEGVRDHGTVGEGQPFTIREGAAGRVEVIRPPGA